MSDNQQFARLLEEFRRVGVDPDTFSAVIAVRPEDARRVLRELPDGAGPAAFLHGLRGVRGRSPERQADPSNRP